MRQDVPTREYLDTVRNCNKPKQRKKTTCIVHLRNTSGFLLLFYSALADRYEYSIWLTNQFIECILTIYKYLSSILLQEITYL